MVFSPARSSLFPALVVGTSALALVAVAASCGKKDSDSNSSGSAGGTLETKFARSRLTSKENALILALAAKARGERVNLSATSAFGNSSPESFTSAKFHISNITLCGDTTMKNGDSCDTRPWQLLGNDSVNYDSFVPKASLSFKGWTDFLDKASASKLVTTATYTDTNVGDYTSVVVNFGRTFRVTASVPMNDGTTVYTKATTDFRSNGKDKLDVTYAGVGKSMLTAPAEETTMFLPNGGKTFFLQKPFQITADDVKNKTSFKMVLAYDPNGAVKASSVDADGYFTQPFLEGQIDLENDVRIQAPFLEFSPVLARSNETVQRETYMVSVPGIAIGENEADTKISVRLTFYYVKEDALKTVRAVTTTFLYNEDSTLPYNFNPLGQIRSVKDGAGGTVSLFQGSLATPTLKDFKRLSKEGETGTVAATLCIGGASGTKCEGKTKAETLTYTFLGSADVDAVQAVSYVTPKPSPSPTATP